MNQNTQLYYKSNTSKDAFGINKHLACVLRTYMYMYIPKQNWLGTFTSSGQIYQQVLQSETDGLDAHVCLH